MEVGILSKFIQIVLRLTGLFSSPEGDRVCTNIELGGVANHSIKENAYWLYGNVAEDHDTMLKIRKMVCEELAIPVVVFSMAPMTELQYHDELDYYEDKTSERPVQSWEEYHARIDYVAEWIAEIPSIIILEPKLLARAVDLVHPNGTDRDQIISFAESVEKMVKQFRNSWIYIDVTIAGSTNTSFDQVVQILKNMPPFIRGVSLNVGSYQSTEVIAEVGEYINCKTGFHYVIDTSRNGGQFSQRPSYEIENCLFDPPGVAPGVFPIWKDASMNQQKTIDGFILGREKRWTFDGSDEDELIYEYYSSGDNYDYFYNFSKVESNLNGLYYLPGVDPCIGLGQALDANLWVKGLGHSDGRLFPAGSYHPCLANHSVECSDFCPEFVQKKNGRFARSVLCKC